MVDRYKYENSLIPGVSVQVVFLSVFYTPLQRILLHEMQDTRVYMEHSNGPMSNLCKQPKITRNDKHLDTKYISLEISHGDTYIYFQQIKKCPAFVFFTGLSFGTYSASSFYLRRKRDRKTVTLANSR